MANEVIRRAGAEDAERLTELGAATFHATFGHLYSPPDLAAFYAKSHVLQRTREQLADPGSAAWLLELDEDPVGYALAGPCALPHPDVTPACGELKRLYLKPAFQGGGRGSRLLRTALSWLEAEKSGSLWIGVWSQNFGAQRLYERLGFGRVGEYFFEVGAARDLDFILQRK